MDVCEKLDAIESIKCTKARYFRAVDQKDRELLRSVFSDDFEMDNRGAVTDPATGFNIAPATDVVVHGAENAVNAIMDAVEHIQSVHHASVPEIEITGPTTASAIWPMVDRIRFAPGGPFKELIGYGYYFESYKKAGDHWRILQMHIERTRLDFIPA